jgi:hypothetical protein
MVGSLELPLRLTHWGLATVWYRGKIAITQIYEHAENNRFYQPQNLAKLNHQ